MLPLCYGSTPPASPLLLVVEDGRRPDDDVVILCVVSQLGTPLKKGKRSSRTGIMILLQVLLQKPCYDFSFL